MAQLIYVIEDDESIRALLDAALTSEGYQVRGFSDAAPALKAMAEHRPALVIFDIMLEGMDGITALKLMRQRPELRRIKAMMLTARDTETDKITGLDAGADDYMTKPFSVLELCARVRALLRRVADDRPVLEDRYEFGALAVDTKAREVTVDGRPVELTYKEFELLKTLILGADRALGREELLQTVWGYDFIGETRTLDMHVGTLRQKLGDDPSNPKYIKTVRGVGYRFIGGRTNG